jgi:hypothetical protein
VGDLSKLSVSGGGFGEARTFVESLIKATGSAGGFREFGKGKLSSLDPKVFLKSLGLDINWSDVEEIARTLGITLNGTKQSYLDLLAAMQQADMKAFFDSWAGQMAGMENTFKLFDISKATDQFDALLKKLGGEKGAPEIVAMLGDLDASTEEGRRAAKEALRKLFEQIQAGEVDIAKFGNLNPQEMLDAIMRLAGFLDDAAQQAAQAVSDALGTLAEKFDIEGTDAADRFRAMADKFAELFPQFGNLMDGINQIAGQGDVDALRKRLLDAWHAIEQGGIDASEQPIADFIKAMLDTLGQAATDAGATTKPGGTVDVKRQVDLTERQGVSLLGFARTQTTILREQLDQLRAIRDALGGGATLPGAGMPADEALTAVQDALSTLTAPSAMGGRDADALVAAASTAATEAVRSILLNAGALSGGIRPPSLGGGAAAGGVTVNVQVSVQVSGAMSSEQAFGIGQRIGAGITDVVRGVNEGLGAELTLARRRGGSVALQ